VGEVLEHGCWLRWELPPRVWINYCTGSESRGARQGCDKVVVFWDLVSWESFYLWLDLGSLVITRGIGLPNMGGLLGLVG